MVETLGEIHNTHKGYFDGNFKKEVDDKIAENNHLFNPLQLYVDEKGDENHIMIHTPITKKNYVKPKVDRHLAKTVRYTVLKQCSEIVLKNLEQISLQT